MDITPSLTALLPLLKRNKINFWHLKALAARHILIWWMRMSQNFLQLPVPFSFPFSRPFYSRHLLRFIFFLAVPESWVLCVNRTKPENMVIIN